MPHDARGRPLQAGDEVTMRFEVQSVGTGDEDCNVMLGAIDVAESGQSYLPTVSCNTKLVEKCDGAPAPDGATDGGAPAFALHPAMSPHGILTPADGFQSLLGAIGAQSAPSLIIQVMGFLAQRSNFFPTHGAEWARWCAATADVIAATAGTVPAAPHPAPVGNLP